ncbi:MAG: type I secretion C-terminal target domain-containing protein [Rhizobiales bacterium]|nr:type I secretion C-terminal target domain-containing protein [Hyphomicrobiales bacterium]
MTNPAAGEWVFTGSEAEANALKAVVFEGATAGVNVVSVSAVTIDQASTLAVAITDTFRLVVPTVINGTPGDDTLAGTTGRQLIFGAAGIDTIDAGDGFDLLVGGTGADILTGGNGADTFRWEVGDLGTGVDTITDFGTGNDALDISALLIGFDPATSVIAEFVQLSVGGGDTTVRIDPNGGGDNFTDLVVLENVTGLDVDTMRANGNLIV